MDVDEAMRLTPREGFLRVEQRRHADLDQPLSIGGGQTNSQPTTVRNMLGLLDVRPGQHVLDVGAGSGWTTAILSRLAAPDGEVLGLEIDPELARWGADNLRRAGVTNARLEPAEPGVLGRPEEGPYDRILVSADARTLPEPLVDQLALGGVMVVPVRGRMTRVVATEGEPQVTGHGAYRFVPLV